MRFLPALYAALFILIATPVAAESSLSYTKTNSRTNSAAKEAPMSETAQTIWDKYKMLIQSTQSSEESKKKAKTIAIKPIKKIEKIKEPQTKTSAKKNETTSGIANILETYQNTKKSRSKMQSLKIRKAEPASDLAEETQE